MVLMLKDIKKRKYKKGETFYSEIGVRLLRTRGGKLLDKRRVSSCAYVERHPKCIRLVLFDTPIAVFNRDGGMVLNTGGWHTKFTRGVINQLLPDEMYLWSVMGQWLMRAPHFSGGFQDGMIVFENSKVRGGMTVADLKEQKKLLDKSKRFIKRYIERLLAGKIDKPGPSDCFECQAESGARNISVKSMDMHGIEHELSFCEKGGHVRHHIDQGYFVPAILWNAIQEAGGPAKLNSLTQTCMYYLWEQGGKEGKVTANQFNSFKNVLERGVKALLNRYIKRRIGIEFQGGGWQSR